MDEIETKFLQTQEFQPLARFKYIVDIWTHGPDKPVPFMIEFNDHRPNVKFTYKSNKEKITFFDLNVGLSRKKLAFHPLLKGFGNIAKNLYFSYIGQGVQRVFKSGPMITFRSARKLSSYLARAKLSQLERTVGFCKCYGK